MTKPARKLVEQLIKDVRSASLFSVSIREKKACVNNSIFNMCRSLQATDVTPSALSPTQLFPTYRPHHCQKKLVQGPCVPYFPHTKNWRNCWHEKRLPLRAVRYGILLFILACFTSIDLNSPKNCRWKSIAHAFQSMENCWWNWFIPRRGNNKL